MATLCRNCAGTLIYDPKNQSLICKTCGSAFTPEEVEDSDKELFQKSERLREAKVYICNHCGSEVELNDSEASSFCLYCGNPAIVFSRVVKTRCPDKLIPFKITKKQAMDKLIPYLRTSKILDEDQRFLWLEKIRGIYLPYWLVSGTLHDTVQLLSGTNSGVTVIDRNKSYTTIKGKLKAQKLPVYGSNMISYRILESIESWDFNEAVPFDEDYLAGFYSDASDIDFDKLKKYIGNRTDNLFRRKIKVDIDDQSDVAISYEHKFFQFDNIPEYVLVPVWFMTVNNRDGTRLTFMMNGQTGECYGAFPAKIKKTFTASLKKTYFIALCSIPVVLRLSMRYAFRSWDRLRLPLALILLCTAVVLFLAACFIKRAIDNDSKNGLSALEITEYSNKRKEG